MEFPRLFSPIRIGNCLLPNRIMSTAAVTRLAEEDGHITEAITSRYTRMAKGGLGAMVVEAAVVLPSRSSFNLRISDDAFVNELKVFVESIRAANSEVKIGLQLIHFLKLSRSGWRQKPEDLKEEEIQAIPEQFAKGALRAKKAGFDFVELHMAHFTTLASFLSLVNKRMDPWGGDFEGRVHLPEEVILAVRESVGTGYPVGMRMNGEEFTKEGNTLLQSERIARRLAAVGVDYISVSAGERFEDAEPPLPNAPPFAGTGYSGYRMSPRWWNPDGVQVYLAEGIRKAVRASGYEIPIVTAGKIRTPKHAEKILDRSQADIIGMARALLCDPDWPLKAREGRSGQIVPCAACGFCSEADERYEKVTCIQWPKDSLNPPSPWLLAPPCSAACPAGINIREYVDLITQGNYGEALEGIREKCPFPGVVSRICPAFCEKKCNRAKFDEPIAVNSLKRFLVERMGVEHKSPEQGPRTRKERVAVVGSGPAGLTAAYYLVRMGYGATVYEALPVPGGMMSVGIQESRLPRDLVNAEIENIRRAGVEIRTSSPVGVKGVPLESLMQQGFKAIFLAVGTKRKRELKLPGGGPVGFAVGEIPDLSFLEDSPLKRSSKNVIETDPQTLKTNVEGVFAGGDMVHGPTSVIQAVASGRRAAFSIHKYLSGETHETGEAEPLTIGIDAVHVDRFKKRRRQESPKTGAYDENTAMREADRCFQCGMFPKK
jgi:dimethylglycine catabolism A